MLSVTCQTASCGGLLPRSAQAGPVGRAWRHVGVVAPASVAGGRWGQPLGVEVGKPRVRRGLWLSTSEGCSLQILKVLPCGK